MDDLTVSLPGLSPVPGRPLKGCVDEGTLSSDAAVLALREVEGRLGVAERLDDPRGPALIAHALADMIGFRRLSIAAGYEDGNDAAKPRLDPLFKMAQGIAPSRTPRHAADDPAATRQGSCFCESGAEGSSLSASRVTPGSYGVMLIGNERQGGVAPGARS